MVEQVRPRQPAPRLVRLPQLLARVPQLEQRREQAQQRLADQPKPEAEQQGRTVQLVRWLVLPGSSSCIRRGQELL